MPWQQLTVQVPEARAEAIETALQNLGAVSVTLRDAEDEAVFQLDPGTTPIWRQTSVVGLFEADAALLAIAAALKAETGLPLDAMQLENLPDQNWERAWMDDFKPMQFGKRLWVCPSWSEPPDPQGLNIMLDPGLAFGTGTHPTTALCLEWLDEQNLTGKTVIDYGCGSGILAIAAVLCGAADVVAIDNDPQAITACENNREMNGLPTDAIRVFLPDQVTHQPADFMLANILSGPLQALTPVLAALTRPGGRIVLSGVLSEQTTELMESYQAYFNMNAPVIREEWVRIDGIRKDDCSTDGA